MVLEISCEIYKFWYEQKGHITRNVHVKYESPTSNGSKDKDKVKVFVTDRQTDRCTDKWMDGQTNK